ncbi:hypothetical protein ACFYO9_37375 [Streptomyces sp. NPDC005863]|uniref:hypothetical protein n=1 Tax=Streptomyces sp. NPDC005863 TaxID=3364735 RepID=UPI0036A24AA4
MSVDLFDADRAAASAEVRAERAATTTRDVWAEFDRQAPENALPHEIAGRFAAALRDGDDDARVRLAVRARQLDEQQPFGPRLMDEIRRIARDHDEPAVA